MLVFLTLSALAEPVRVTLSFEDASRHLVDVTASYPAADGGHELVMASWTPGSYKVRDYAKHVEAMRVSSGGDEVAWRKVAKNRWRIDHDGPISVQYRVYARELAVQTSFVDEEVASLNGASLFMWEDGRTGPWEVTVQPREGWELHTALPGTGTSRTADSLDTLLDSPMLLGAADMQTFEVAGTPHSLVSIGFAPSFSAERAAADLAVMVEAHRAFWGSLPYDSYDFLAVGLGGGGGLEHLASTLMLTGPDTMQDDASHLRWMGLASHEFFHTWNVKRLRPAEYGPFDYEREVHSEGLWVAEGLTSYYGDLLLHRAGLMDEAALLDELSTTIGRVQGTPGREVRSLQEASFDAWIKHYQRDENTRNSTISYYGKGAVVGFLLDAEIRRRTEGRASLDDVMRLAYERFSGDTGFTSEGFADVVSEVTGEPMNDWLQRAVGSTEELDYTPALELYGLRFPEPELDPSPWLGVGLSGGAISWVERGSPAWGAGLAVGDELIAIDGRRVRGLDASLERHKAGQEVTVLVARRQRIEERRVTLGSARPSYALTSVDKPTRAQKRARAAWLGTPE
jgi:predicted metalloprotease with PDZ domain